MKKRQNSRLDKKHLTDGFSTEVTERATRPGGSLKSNAGERQKGRRNWIGEEETKQRGRREKREERDGRTLNSNGRNGNAR